MSSTLSFAIVLHAILISILQIKVLEISLSVSILDSQNLDTRDQS